MFFWKNQIFYISYREEYLISLFLYNSNTNANQLKSYLNNLCKLVYILLHNKCLIVREKNISLKKSYFTHIWPLNRACFDPWDILCTIVVEVIYNMFPTTYLNIMLSGIREDVSEFFYFTLSKNKWL